MPADPDSQTTPDVELTIVMPCLNEAETLATCVRKAMRFLRENGVAGEVLVADNGSTDGSQEIARAEGARVVAVAAKGYGSALMGGIQAARGRYIAMGDSDDSYDFLGLMPFLEKLREGYDLVMGNRFRGGIQPGAMPPLHRYLGNPVLTTIGRILFRCPSKDFHCGLRGFSREAAGHMDLQTTGMEFASEMVIKATLHGMRIAEVPTTLSPDGRSRPPHLRSWRDGWRHLRFMLLFSPNWLFVYPGLFVMVAGTLFGLRLLAGPLAVGGVHFDIQTMLFAATAVVIGYQSVLFGLFSKVFAINTGLLPRSSRLAHLPRFATLETGVLAGVAMVVAGLAGSLYAVYYWGHESNFGRLDPRVTLRIVIPAVTALIVGLQTILGSLFLSVLGLGRRGAAGKTG